MTAGRTIRMTDACNGWIYDKDGRLVAKIVPKWVAEVLADALDDPSKVQHTASENFGQHPARKPGSEQIDAAGNAHGGDDEQDESGDQQD